MYEDVYAACTKHRHDDVCRTMRTRNCTICTTMYILRVPSTNTITLVEIISKATLSARPVPSVK
jgi:hypothetical protein